MVFIVAVTVKKEKGRHGLFCDACLFQAKLFNTVLCNLNDLSVL